MNRERYFGLLKKINAYACAECQAVYLPPDQAAKIGIKAGWYRTDREIYTQGQKNGWDPVVRHRGGRRNQRKCPFCNGN